MVCACMCASVAVIFHWERSTFATLKKQVIACERASASRDNYYYYYLLLLLLLLYVHTIAGWCELRGKTRDVYRIYFLFLCVCVCVCFSVCVFFVFVLCFVVCDNNIIVNKQINKQTMTTVGKQTEQKTNVRKTTLFVFFVFLFFFCNCVHVCSHRREREIEPQRQTKTNCNRFIEICLLWSTAILYASRVAARLFL